MPDHQAPDLGQSPQLYHRHLTTGKQTLQIPSGCAFPQHMQRSTLPGTPPQPGHPSWSPASVNQEVNNCCTGKFTSSSLSMAHALPPTACAAAHLGHCP